MSVPDQLFQQQWRERLEESNQSKYYPGSNQRVDVAAGILGTGNRLLDVGCGSGVLACALGGKFREVFGVDVADSAIEVARGNGVIASRVDLNREALPFDTEFFDAVTFLSAISYIYDPIHALQECHRVLRKGGTLVLSTANMRTLGKLYKISVGGRFPTTSKGVHIGYDGGAIHYFCSKDVCSLLTGIHFHVVEKRGLYYRPRFTRIFEKTWALRSFVSEFLAGEMLLIAKKL